MRHVILTLALILLGGTVQAAMLLRPAVSGFRNEIGVGVSYGVKLDKDAFFVGYAPDYVRTLGEKWIFNASLAYDQETETKDGSQSVVETWTPSLMVGYQVTDRLAVGGGVGHGLVENDGNQGWKSVVFGKDVSVAAAFAVSLWNRGRHGLALSVSLEHNISEGEPSVSTDIGYSWGF